LNGGKWSTACGDPGYVDLVAKAQNRVWRSYFRTLSEFFSLPKDKRAAHEARGICGPTSWPCGLNECFMMTDKIKDLAAARERVAQLEAMIAADLKRELGRLAGQIWLR